MGTVSTKDKIRDIAIFLFSDKGYDKVSMRDIAGKVGIKAASIYNHFSSKEDILKSLYVFYSKQQKMATPDMEELLRMVETESIQVILAKMDYHYTPEIEEKMDRIFLIASNRIHSNVESQRFIQKHLFGHLNEFVSPLLNRMIELGRIEPISVDAFLVLLSYYSFGAAILNSSPIKIGLEKWQHSLGLLFSLLKPISS